MAHQFATTQDKVANGASVPVQPILSGLVHIGALMSSKAFEAPGAALTSEPKGAAGLARQSPSRTRPHTSVAQGSAGRIWTMYRRWADDAWACTASTATRFMER
jgi:hypothetical protein